MLKEEDKLISGWRELRPDDHDHGDAAPFYCVLAHSSFARANPFIRNMPD